MDSNLNEILDIVSNSDFIRRDHSEENDYSMRKKMSSEERNRIVKEYYEKERLEKEKEYSRLKEVAKSKGLDTTIGCLEV